MKLDSFKELLLKKAADMPDLQTLIKYMKDDFLLEHVVESLAKAHDDNHKNVNDAVSHFASRLSPKRDIPMIHDALSHHASYYKAALNAGNKDLADAHAAKLFKIMHLAHKITKDKQGDHSEGALKVENADPKPWERTHYKPESEGGSVTDGWKRKGGEYSKWLSAHPHSDYVEKLKDKDAIDHHGKPYPLEDIKINGKYIDIDPNVQVPKVSKKGPRGVIQDMVSHEFDKHPIFKHYDTPVNVKKDAKVPKKPHGKEEQAQYESELKEYLSGPHVASFMEAQKAFHPDRGNEKSDPVHTEENNQYKDVAHNNPSRFTSSEPIPQVPSSVETTRPSSTPIRRAAPEQVASPRTTAPLDEDKMARVQKLMELRAKNK
jgi:hypothetical protein